MCHIRHEEGSVKEKTSKEGKDCRKHGKEEGIKLNFQNTYHNFVKSTTFPLSVNVDKEMETNNEEQTETTLPAQDEIVYFSELTCPSNASVT